MRANDISAPRKRTAVASAACVCVFLIFLSSIYFLRYVNVTDIDEIHIVLDMEQLIQIIFYSEAAVSNFHFEVSGANFQRKK